VFLYKALSVPDLPLQQVYGFCRRRTSHDRIKILGSKFSIDNTSPSCLTLPVFRPHTSPGERRVWAAPAHRVAQRGDGLKIKLSFWKATLQLGGVSKVSTSSRKDVPLVVIEEHHEAFYVWHYATQEGWLGRNGNTLLHVDEHADMFLPRLRRPLASISSLADLAEFTYNELNIGNFIWPAVYLGFFSRVLWLRNKHEISAGGWRTISICGKDGDKREFIAASSLASTPYGDAEDIRSVEYAPVTTGEFLSTELPVVLDIDLDYFCSNERPVVLRELEITASAFEEFHRNPYHFLRISPGVKVTAVVRQGRYLLLYEDGPQPPDPIATERSLTERIDDFVRYLHQYSVVPPLIVVCRSLHSGYTPPKYAAFIESTLFGRLNTLYSLKILPVPGLVSAIGNHPSLQPCPAL